MINVLMSFGAVAVAAGTIGLEPAFTTGAALGVVLVAIGLGISFFAAELWGLLGTANTIIGALLLAGGVIELAKARFRPACLSATPYCTVIGSGQHNARLSVMADQSFSGKMRRFGSGSKGNSRPVPNFCLGSRKIATSE